MSALVSSLLFVTALGSPAPAAPAPIPDAAGLFEQENQEPAYKPEGRRDPFVPLAAQSTQRRTSCPLPGLAALPIDTAALRGIVRTPGGPIAMLTGPDGRSYFAHAGERLCDGEITSIGPEVVEFRQEVIDPLSPKRSREVKRVLHP